MPFRIGDSENNGPFDERVLLQDFFHLGRIDIFPSRLYEFFFSLSTFIPKEANFIQAPQIAGVVPSIAKAIGIGFFKLPVTLKNVRTSGHNFAHFVQPESTVAVINNANLSKWNGPPC